VRQFRSIQINAATILSVVIADNADNCRCVLRTDLTLLVTISLPKIIVSLIGEAIRNSPSFFCPLSHVEHFLRHSTDREDRLESGLLHVNAASTGKLPRRHRSTHLFSPHAFGKLAHCPRRRQFSIRVGQIKPQTWVIL